MTFELDPAVRATDSCIDEGNCEYETYTLCAFDGAPDMDTKVAFLVCMDKSTVGNDAAQAAKQCLASSEQWTSVSDCATGSKGAALLKDASDVFNKALPGRTQIPHTFVNQQDVQPTYSALKKALCSAGSSASVCSSSSAVEPCYV